MCTLKALIQRYVDELNRRNLAVLDELVAEDVILRSLLRTESADVVTGREAYREGILQRITAFPDYHVTILEMLAEGDQVMVYWRNQGTHQGTFRGVPPTGRLIEERAVSLYRIAHGQIVEVRGFGDWFDFLTQMGQLPARSAPEVA